MPELSGLKRLHTCTDYIYYFSVVILVVSIAYVHVEWSCFLSLQSLNRSNQHLIAFSQSHHPSPQHHNIIAQLSISILQSMMTSTHVVRSKHRWAITCNISRSNAICSLKRSPNWARNHLEDLYGPEECNRNNAPTCALTNQTSSASPLWLLCLVRRSFPQLFDGLKKHLDCITSILKRSRPWIQPNDPRRLFSLDRFVPSPLEIPLSHPRFMRFNNLLMYLWHKQFRVIYHKLCCSIEPKLPSHKDARRIGLIQRSHPRVKHVLTIITNRWNRSV